MLQPNITAQDKIVILSLGITGNRKQDKTIEIFIKKGNLAVRANLPWALCIPTRTELIPINITYGNILCEALINKVNISGFWMFFENKVTIFGINISIRTTIGVNIKRVPIIN
jgi:hypothetical protein